MNRPSDYLQYLRQRLEEWEYQFDRFQHRMEDLSDELRDQASERLAGLKQRSDALRTKIAELENQSELALEDIRDGLDLAWDSLRLGLLSARGEFGQGAD